MRQIKSIHFYSRAFSQWLSAGRAAVACSSTALNLCLKTNSRELYEHHGNSCPMVTFKGMTEVFQDKVMTGSNRLLEFFYCHYSLIFTVFNTPKDIVLQQKLPEMMLKYVCVLYVNTHHFRAN